jgi:type IV fimbrial biogenesis protein FimT
VTCVQKSSQGLTLLELAISLAIVAVLLVLAVPSFQRLHESHQMNRALLELSGAVQQAQLYAIMHHQSIRLSAYNNDTSTCYVVHTGTKENCQCTPPAGSTCTAADAKVIQTIASAQLEPIETHFNGASMLFGAVYGTSTPAGTFTLKTQSGRVVHYVVNMMGRGRACSPGGQMPGYVSC